MAPCWIVEQQSTATLLLIQEFAGRLRATGPSAEVYQPLGDFGFFCPDSMPDTQLVSPGAAEVSLRVPSKARARAV